MKKARGKKAKYVILAEKGLLEEPAWRVKLQSFPLGLICLIRKELLKSVPGVTEKFNGNSRYFGYRDDKDRIYIYIQKKQLVIDLCISPDFASTLINHGFKVKPRDNFQGQNGWLTGWQVPHTRTDINFIVKSLNKAFERNL